MKYAKDYSLLQNLKWTLSDYKRSVVNFGHRLAYHYNGGYKCASCGILIPIKFNTIRTEVDGKGMIISNHSSELYCAHCLAEKVDQFFRYADLDECPCDWIADKKMSIGVIGKWFGTKQNMGLAELIDLDMRFGSNYWNGHHASREALMRGLMNPNLEYKTIVISYDKKLGAVHVDRHGIKIPCKGDKWL